MQAYAMRAQNGGLLAEKLVEIEQAHAHNQGCVPGMTRCGVFVRFSFRPSRQDIINMRLNQFTVRCRWQRLRGTLRKQQGYRHSAGSWCDRKSSGRHPVLVLASKQVAVYITKDKSWSLDQGRLNSAPD